MEIQQGQIREVFYTNENEEVLNRTEEMLKTIVVPSSSHSVDLGSHCAEAAPGDSSAGPSRGVDSGSHRAEAVSAITSASASSSVGNSVPHCSGVAPERSLLPVPVDSTNAPVKFSLEYHNGSVWQIETQLTPTVVSPTPQWMEGLRTFSGGERVIIPPTGYTGERII